MQQPDFAAIPNALKTWRQFVVWRYQQRGEKKTKPPYSPTSGSLAAVDNPGTWGTFEEARRACASSHFAGVAFILASWDPFTGVDLDHALEDGQIAPWARSIVDHFHSYTEWSPSRQGLHIWLRGTLPGPRRRKGAVEMYQDFRALTVTGWHLEGTPLTIELRQEELEAYYRHLFADEVKRQAQPVQPQVSVDLSDANLIVRAERARNGARFARLWAGNT